MLKDQRKRQTRCDKGKPRRAPKWQMSPEYHSYITRKDYRPRRLTEDELLAILAEGCTLCGDPATKLLWAKPYCPRCDCAVLALGGEDKAKAFARACQYAL